jgi:hypothetical protein
MQAGVALEETGVRSGGTAATRRSGRQQGEAITSRPYSDHAPTDLLPQVTSPRPVYGSAKRARH